MSECAVAVGLGPIGPLCGGGRSCLAIIRLLPGVAIPHAVVVDGGVAAYYAVLCS